MFAHDFVRNAYLAGTFIALACGIVGWFVVLRGQVFAGDALSHVAFVGAVAAAVVGLDERIGLFALTLLLAAGMGALGRRAHADDVVIGTVFAWILGIGVLLLSLLATSASGGNGIAGVNTLFGSIYELTPGAARLAAAIALAVTASVALAARPLLLSTLDAELAAVRGVPVRALGVMFLLALAIVTAQSTEAVGALLLLGLVAAPAGAAHKLCARPLLSMALSGALAVAAMWGGLALSYAVPSLPPSSAIIGLAAGAYGLSALAVRAWRPLKHGWCPRYRRAARDGSRGPGRRRCLGVAGHARVATRRTSSQSIDVLGDDSMGNAARGCPVPSSEASAARRRNDITGSLDFGRKVFVSRASLGELCALAGAQGCTRRRARGRASSC